MKINENINNIISIDPGEKTFLTGLTSKNIYKIGKIRIIYLKMTEINGNKCSNKSNNNSNNRR